MKTSKIGYTDIRGMKDIVFDEDEDMANQEVKGKLYLFLDQVTDP